jgi:hypothetical protein
MCRGPDGRLRMAFAIARTMTERISAAHIAPNHLAGESRVGKWFFDPPRFAMWNGEVAPAEGR